MEDNLIKPDVVFVTKNVMVPLALPTSNKSFNVPSDSMKKMKIAKPRKNKARKNLRFSQDDECGKVSFNEKPRRIIRANCERSEDSLRETKTDERSELTGGTEINDLKKTLESDCETILLPKSMGDDEIEEESSSGKYEQEGACIIRKEEEIITDETSSKSQDSIPHSQPHIASRVNFELPNGQEDKTLANRECEIKYSWQDLDNWIPPCEKKRILESEEKSVESLTAKSKALDCEIKYSWQIIGTGVQTSEEFISNLPSKDSQPLDTRNYPCTIKYSWQIIGTGAQVSFRESGKDPARYEKDYWDGKILVGSSKREDDKSMSQVLRGKIFYNEKTQTMADKVNQADTMDCRVKYSWQNLTKRYLQADKRF